MKPIRLRCSALVANLIAFVSVLAAIVALALAGKGTEAIMTGLVGVLGSFRPWAASGEHPSGEKE